MENRRSNMSCWASGLVRKILHGTPGLTRTADTRFRKPLLYPLSYRGIDSRQSREPPSHPRELPAGMLPTGRRRVKARLQRGGPRRHGLAMRAQLWGRSIERPLSVPKGGFEPPLGLPELRPERSASAIPPLRHEPRGLTWHNYSMGTWAAQGIIVVSDYGGWLCGITRWALYLGASRRRHRLRECVWKRICTAGQR